MQLNARQYEALYAVCDTFVPSIQREDDTHGYWRCSANHLHVPAAIIVALSQLPDTEQRQFRFLLDLLSSQLLGLTCWGPFRPFVELPRHERERIMRSWADSHIPILRAAFEQLRKLVVFMTYSAPAAHTNPLWPTIGYEGPLPHTKRNTNTIQPTYQKEDLNCDVVVIGSGAGGSVVAAELAQAGHSVVILEKGPFVTERHMNQSERDMVNVLYERQGNLLSHDGALQLFAGSCVGGGTTVNWAGAFRTSPAVLHEWATQHHLPHVANDSLQDSYSAVESALSVNPVPPQHNPQNQMLLKGTQALGYSNGAVPRNEQPYPSQQAWKAAGFSQFGSHEGTKQGTLKTYLQHACQAGARLLPRAEAQRIASKQGRVTGVHVTQIHSSGTSHSFFIRAKRVVVAAGSLHTPALLQRSGLQHPHIGRHLFVHPAVVVSARYPQTIRSWWGPMMSAYTDEFAYQSNNYGVKIETAPLHPGFLAIGTPWRSGWQHKERMADAAHLGHFVLFARDQDAGHITLTPTHQPQIHYQLSPRDLRHLLVGMGAATRIHLAAGAQRVQLPHRELPTYEASHEIPSLEQIFEHIARTYRWKKNDFPLFSAHQMGTCRMGGNATTAPLTPEGETRECKGLFVADGSVFPGSCGTNPMLTIMAMAHHTAQHIKSRSK